MKKASKISVIVPVYNVAKYLNRCVESIVGQTYQNLEIVLVDDGSTDASKKYCDAWRKKDSRIKVVHQKNRGLSAARNTGIKKSTGKYLVFVDADDYLAPSHIEDLYHALSATKADIAVAAHQVIYPKRTLTVQAPAQATMLSKDALHALLYHQIDTAAWSKLYKKSLFKRIKYPVGKFAEDTATTYKLFHQAKLISFCHQPTYYYVIHPQSLTTTSFSKKYLELVEATDQMAVFITTTYPEFATACTRRQVFARLSTLSQLAKSSTRNSKVERSLSSFVRQNRRTVLADRSAPLRDKLGILSLCLGFGFYRQVWRVYLKLSGRRLSHA